VTTRNLGHCEKTTQRGTVCGAELLPDTTCPFGYRHAEAPRYPRTWAPIVLLCVGGIITFLGITGGLDFIGPFSDVSSAGWSAPVTVGSTHALSAGQTYGLYAITQCPTTSGLIATFDGAGGTITVVAGASQPVYTEQVGVQEGQPVQQCGTFVAPHTATYTTTSLAGEFGLVPSSELVDFYLYYGTFFAGLALLALGGVWLGLVLRRRNHARDPFEHADISHDTIAQAARANARFMELEGDESPD
jgi:hypothetical protein